MQTLAEAVVVDDEELDQHCFLRVADGFENRFEGGRAVDQQAHFIVRQARHAPQFRHRSQGGVGIGSAGGQGFFDPGTPVQLGDGLAHFFVGLAPRVDVAIEGTTAEDQVRNECQVGNEQQRQGPGDRALGGPNGQHGVNGGNQAQRVQ